MESILLAFTGLRLDGGISSVSRTMAAVLDEQVDAGRLQRTDRVLLHDRADDAPSPPPRGVQRTCEGSQLRFSLQLWGTLLRRRPDLVFFDHVGLGRALLPGLPGPRPDYAVFVHGLELDGADGDARAEVLRHARRLCANSELTARRVAELVPECAERIRVTPLCIEPAKREHWERLARDADPPREPAALIVGRMWADQPGKGHDALIAGWPRVLERVAGAELWIVGQGDDARRLHELAVRCGVDGSVKFLGRVSDEKLSELYRRASLFAMPSQQEGFGLVYLEAMLHGLPCLGSTADAAGLVIDPSSGVLVPYDDAEATAAAVSEILGDPALRDRLGAGGRRRVSEDFAPERFRASLLDALLG